MSETSYHLARGVAVVVRDSTHLQFGLDATRAGVITTPHAHALAEIFRELTSPVPRGLLITDITARTGTDDLTAAALIDDLVAFRILVPRFRDSVYVLGRSPLAKHLCAHFSDIGFSVRRPMRSETDAEFLGRVPQAAAAVLVDKLAWSHTLAARMQYSQHLVLPVNTIDQHVVVGPVRTRGVGPCLVCHQLHYAQVDGKWNAVVSRFPAGPPSTDPTVIAAGVAAASTQLRRAIGPALPPGVTHTLPAPGEIVVADPFATPALSTRTMARHPQCPVCRG
ncbi:hypothetical protein [Corynebacterium cystitidis]|uniref:Bacteriocin biosynthesis cyclodehydratase domain-containing protein n=1 Tax=Corynebacterium cystitidis DSM 20524 TaxID=1121357 RepID=A0A1H9QFN5_9CORY|nr:hypothetical protein [Corynebacterium cystitidis]WJY81809.1 hypothetical protein CCYS_04275 [Corynebacterium cystitidis DSM 20524]SER59238.1 hypothetical protein SAMN05661109_00512 [Corynebacterium cystitidis DSM 20524]SNV83412.1 bacteriocin biosynthesis cyclodehydratase domain [Corynebacterium cystitidis]